MQLRLRFRQFAPEDRLFRSEKIPRVPPCSLFFPSKIRHVRVVIPAGSVREQPLSSACEQDRRDLLRCSLGTDQAKGQEPKAALSPDTLLPAIQLFDLWVLRRFLEIAAPGPYYFVLKHAILEPNGGPTEA